MRVRLLASSLLVFGSEMCRPTRSSRASTSLSSVQLSRKRRLSSTVAMTEKVSVKLELSWSDRLLDIHIYETCCVWTTKVQLPARWASCKDISEIHNPRLRAHASDHDPWVNTVGSRSPVVVRYTNSSLKSPRLQCSCNVPEAKFHGTHVAADLHSRDGIAMVAISTAVDLRGRADQWWRWLPCPGYLSPEECVNNDTIGRQQTTVRAAIDPPLRFTPSARTLLCLLAWSVTVARGLSQSNCRAEGP